MYKQIDSNKRQSFFLMFVFVLVIVALAWVWQAYYEGSYYLVALAAVFALSMSLVSFYSGDKIALASAGAKEIKKEDHPQIYRLVENLAITAGIPTPKTYIINDSSLNAFATGRDPQHSSIALTTGLISNLEKDELEGVIAHELAHVKNYDIRVMMVVIVCVGLITLLADWMMRSLLWGGAGRGNRNNKSNPIIMIIGLVLIVLSPIFAKLIQLAISRKREYLADASGALLTRYPEGLAKALEKISRQSQPLKRANKATAHLYIANPFAASGKKIGRAFSTHPPIEERIKLLRQM